MEDVGYLYFSKSDYEFIKKNFPKLYSEFEKHVSRREPKIELEVTDSQTDFLDNKVLMIVGESGAMDPIGNGNPSKEASKLEKIWDEA